LSAIWKRHFFESKPAEPADVLVLPPNMVELPWLELIVA
jgi:hypothetical protein